MNVNSVCLCVLVLSLLFECGHSDSPCPDVFDFYTDGKTVFGQITLEPVETVPFLQLRINYTVLATLGDYLGRIDAPDDVLTRYNRGESVNYRVYFPVSSPRPKVTEITLNDDMICTGPPDKLIPNQVLSKSSLQVTNSYGLGGGPPPYKIFRHQPQPKPQIPPRPKPQTTAQPKLQFSVYHDRDYSSAFAEYVNTHAVGQTIPFEQIYQSFGNRNSDSFLFVAPPVTQRTETARPTPTTTTTTTTTRTTTRTTPTTTTTTTTTPTPTTPTPTTPTPTTTTPVYSQPVKKTARPEYYNTAECGVVAGSSNEFSGLIKNGLSYERGEIPWLVAIYKAIKTNLNFICGGTLVSDRHVVTAAHCVQGPRVRLSEQDVVVRVGVHDLNDWSDDIAITSKIINATIHDSFNKSSLRNDIMILTLNKRVLFTDFIRPACLWNGNTELSLVVGATGVVAGWGDDESDEPQMLRVPIVSTQTCRASTPDLYKITSYNTLCAGDRNDSGPCKGDSGGGLYLLDGGKWRLRGVVSLSLHNGNRASECNLNEYVVYTDTAQYLPWIRTVLSQKYFD